MADEKLSQQETKLFTDGEELAHIVEQDLVTGNTESFGIKLKNLGFVASQDLVTGNSILVGGLIFHGVMDYTIWAESFIINNVVYNIDVEDRVTLSDGDGANPRIDTFVITLDATTVPTAVGSVLEGTPAGSPVQDTLDLSTQVQVSFRVVAQSETTDPTSNIDLIYNENVGAAVEWNNSTNTTGGDLDSAVDSYLGSKHFLTPATTSDTVVWTDTGNHSFDSNARLTYAWRIANNTGSGRNQRLQIKLINSATGAFWIKTVSIGNKTVSSDWRLKSIKLSKFAPNELFSSTYNRIEFTFLRTPQVELDWINIQTEIQQPNDPLELVPTQTIDTGSKISLHNMLGNYCNMATANTTSPYSYNSEVLGGFARVLINRATEPSVTGATKIFGSTFLISTNMYLTVHYNGNRAEYWLEKI